MRVRFLSFVAVRQAMCTSGIGVPGAPPQRRAPANLRQNAGPAPAHAKAASRYGPKKKETLAPPAYALLIDADVVPAADWQIVVAAVQAKGPVVGAYAFGGRPAFGEAELQTLPGQVRPRFVEIPQASGGKDPKDIAIALYASELSTVQGAAIALAVQDIDYVYVAEFLQKRGVASLLVTPLGREHAVAQAFEQAGAEVVSYGFADGAAGPKWKAVLNEDGTGKVEVMAAEEVGGGASPGDSKFVAKLLALGYLQQPADPVVPAIAKFFYTHKLGPVAVFPEALARRHAAAMWETSKQRSWQEHVGGLAFVLPEDYPGPSSLAASELLRYGTARCCGVVRAGGPFLLEESAQLVPDFLVRLGYLDADLCTDLGEALDAFRRRGGHLARLNELGVGEHLWSVLLPDAKAALLRSLLVSSCTTGSWQVAAPARRAGERLAGPRLLRFAAGSRRDALAALRPQPPPSGGRAYQALCMRLFRGLDPDVPPLRR